MVFSPCDGAKPEEVPYLAPEHSSERNYLAGAVFTKKSDIWAFGALLYDLCTL
jgi:serine/threonine protein kinase